MTCQEEIIKLIKFFKEDLSKLIIHCYIVIVCITMCIYVYNVYVFEKIYIHAENKV